MAFASLSSDVGSADAEPLAEINMVPLIDVMLVLLVIFIVTAPLLTQAVKLDLPKASVQAEINNMVANARADLKQRGIKDADKAPIPGDLFKDQAERRVRLGLIVADLVRANNLLATPEQVQAHVSELAASYEKPEDVARWYTGDQQRMAEIEAVVTENNVTDFVLGKAKVSEKKVSFDELMGQA